MKTWDKFYIHKNTHTYFDTLECVGLANILKQIIQYHDLDREVDIIEYSGYFCIELDDTITLDQVQSCPKLKLLDNIYFGELDKLPNEIQYDLIIESMRISLQEMPNDTRRENTPDNWTEYRTIKNLGGDKRYQAAVEFFAKENFSKLLEKVFDFYRDFQQLEGVKGLGLKEAVQVISPSMGKGINEKKAKSYSDGNTLYSVKSTKTSMLKQFLSFIGIAHCLIAKNCNIKSKSDFDIKIFTLRPGKVNFNQLETICKSVRGSIFSKSPIQIDILTSLKILQLLITHNEKNLNQETPFQPNKSISGLDISYFKNLGRAKAVSNISFLALPSFIEIKNKEEASHWLEVMHEQQKIISFLEEKKDYEKLIHYRNFISTNDFDSFFSFCFDYTSKLMNEIQKTPKFHEHNLRLLFMSKNNDEKTFTDIIENSGFQAFAKAIRNSTIKEQYNKARGQQVFPIHYELAQNLKRKSDYSDQFIQYLSEFATSYNTETARYAEKHPEKLAQKKIRSTIKDQDLFEMVKLLDQHGSSVLGRLLCAFGYSLEKNERN